MKIMEIPLSEKSRKLLWNPIGCSGGSKSSTAARASSTQYWWLNPCIVCRLRSASQRDESCRTTLRRVSPLEDTHRREAEAWNSDRYRARITGRRSQTPSALSQQVLRDSSRRDRTRPARRQSSPSAETLSSKRRSCSSSTYSFSVKDWCLKICFSLIFVLLLRSYPILFTPK